MNVLATDHLHHEVTPFQTIDIYQTEVFGKVLLLDGHIQLTEFDEKAYHESLVHIPLLNLPNATAALVVGGGDGGVIRELCKAGIGQIDMVEIDNGVVEASKKHLPFLSNGAFEDSRVNLLIEDAFGFVKNQNSKYDLIVVDSTDTYEDEDENLSEALFTTKFYTDCKEALKPGGIVITQADNPVFCPYSLIEIKKSFSAVFDTVGNYTSLVPSFGGYSAFCYGSSGKILADTMPNIDPGRFAYLTKTTYALAFSTLNFS